MQRGFVHALFMVAVLSLSASPVGAQDQAVVAFAARLNAMDSIGNARRGTMPRVIHAGDKVGPEGRAATCCAVARSTA